MIYNVYVITHSLEDILCKLDFLHAAFLSFHVEGDSQVRQLLLQLELLTLVETTQNTHQQLLTSSTWWNNNETSRQND